MLVIAQHDTHTERKRAHFFAIPNMHYSDRALYSANNHQRLFSTGAEEVKLK